MMRAKFSGMENENGCWEGLGGWNRKETMVIDFHFWRVFLLG